MTNDGARFFKTDEGGSESKITMISGADKASGSEPETDEIACELGLSSPGNNTGPDSTPPPKTSGLISSSTDQSNSSTPTTASSANPAEQLLSDYTQRERKPNYDDSEVGLKLPFKSNTIEMPIPNYIAERYNSTEAISNGSGYAPRISNGSGYAPRFYGRYSPWRHIFQGCSTHLSGTFVCTCCNVLICSPCIFGAFESGHVSTIRLSALLIPRYTCLINTAYFWLMETGSLIDCAQHTAKCLNEEIESQMRRLGNVGLFDIPKNDEVEIAGLDYGISTEELHHVRNISATQVEEQSAKLRQISLNLADMIKTLQKIQARLHICKSEEVIIQASSWADQIRSHVNHIYNNRPRSFNLYQRIRRNLKCIPLTVPQNDKSVLAPGPLPHDFASKHDNIPLNSPKNGVQFQEESVALFFGYTMTGVGECIAGTDDRIHVNEKWHPRSSFGRDGAEQGELSRPWGICVDCDGNIIIGDRRNNRIQVFYPNGEFKFAFGSKGSGDGQFELPAGVTTDLQKRIIVADKDNHRIQIFSDNGTFLLKFGDKGYNPGQFQYPWDVASNSIGNIVVSDTRNHRIQLFSASGQFIKLFSFNILNCEKNNIAPRGVCFSPLGPILVTDFENNRVLQVDAKMQTANVVWDSCYPIEFCRPSGLCCDDYGNLLIADSKNQRIVHFDCNGYFQKVINLNEILPIHAHSKDRPCDIAMTPSGSTIVLFETSPDNKEKPHPDRAFVQIF